MSVEKTFYDYKSRENVIGIKCPFLQEKNMKIENFGEKLDKILKERGLKQVQLAEMADITERHLSRMKKNTEIPEIFLKKICTALNLSQLEFLNLGQSNEEFVPDPFRAASGGMGGGSYENSRRVLSHISLRKSFLLTMTNHPEAVSFIRAIGESMSPTIPPDAIVLIDESQIDPINNKIYYILLNDELLIKRLEVKNGYVRSIISDNGYTKVDIADDDNLEIIGRAIFQYTEL